MASLPPLTPQVGLQLHRMQTRALDGGAKQASVVGVSLSLMGVTAIVISVRIWVRICIVKNGIGLDDYLMVAGTLATFGLSIANAICAWYGVGKHLQDIPEENYVGLAQSNFANALCYFAALGLVKAALLVFYLRLDPRKITRYFIFFVLFTVAGLEIASCLIIVFECQPVHKFWDLKNEVPGKCMDVHDRQIFYNANGIINIIQDIIIYVLPIPMLWNLQMPKRQKMALISLFSFGSIAVVASCVRYHYNAKLNSATDLYWYLADALNWCTIELYIAIICGSASTFKILIKRYAPSLWGSNRSKGASGDPSSQGYDQSHSGQFSMRNLKPSSKLAGSTSRRGLHDITTTIGHDSEEAIVDPNQPRAESPGNPYDNKNDIIIKREMRFEVSDSRSEDRIDCNPAQPRGGW